MQAVFQVKKQKKLNLKIFRPFLVVSDFKIFSVAIKSGTKAISNKGAVKGMGGQASHSIKALVNANV